MESIKFFNFNTKQPIRNLLIMKTLGVFFPA